MIKKHTDYSFAKRMGHRGTAMLRIAVMEILYEAYEAKEALGAAEISEKAGIFREGKLAQTSGNDSIIWGILSSLVKDDIIEKEGNGNLWKMVDGFFDDRWHALNKKPDWGGNSQVEKKCRRRQWNFCVGCLGPLSKKIDMDHIIAKSVGGPDTPDNKQALCPSCNRSKQADTFEEFMERRFEHNKWIDYVPEFDQ